MTQITANLMEKTLQTLWPLRSLENFSLRLPSKFVNSHPIVLIYKAKLKSVQFIEISYVLIECTRISRTE